MLKCFRCKKEIDLERDVYESHQDSPNPSCKQCIREASKLSYYKRRARAREIAVELPPPHLISHNVNALQGILRDFRDKNLMIVNLQITGAMVPAAGALRLERYEDGLVYIKAQVTERLTITRNAGLTTISDFSFLLASYRVKVIYGPS